MTVPTNIVATTYDSRHQVLDELIALYLGRGFGNVTKAELDTAFYDAILRTGRLAPDANTSVAMRILGVSSAKHARLKASLELKRDRTPDLDTALKDLLRTPVTLKAKDRVALHVDSALLRAYIRDMLFQQHIAVDGSFARELVVLNVQGYATLLALYVPTTWVERVRAGASLVEMPAKELLRVTLRALLDHQLNQHAFNTFVADALEGSAHAVERAVAWLQLF